MTPAAASSYLDRAARPRLTLPRAHRLKRRRLIRPLFDRERADVHSIASGSVRAVYRFVTDPEDLEDTPVQVAVFVSRRAGHAVRRNRIRRQMREVYRHRHPEIFGALSGRSEMLTLALVFRGRPDIPWKVLARDVNSAVDRFLGEVE